MRRSERKTAPAVTAGWWRRPVALGMVSSVAVTTFGLPAMADVDTQPDETTEAAASNIDLSLIGQELAGGGQSRALYPGGPATDDGALNASLLGGQLLDLGGVQLPIDQIIDYGELGALLSQSTATDAKNGEAISGIAGADGSLSLDGEAGGFGTAKLDLLSLFRATGTDGLTDDIVSKAELTAGVGGAHVEAVDGAFQDPDGVGGDGQYRVAEANLELESPIVSQIASGIYDQLATVDQTLEDTVNGMSQLTDLLNTITSALPVGATIDVSAESNIQEEVFQELLAQPITSKNEVLSIDLSTGKLYVDLDKAYSGERPEGVDLPDGINNQNPNTELISNEIYPIIAETIHDLIEEVIKVATNAIEGAISSITLNFELTQTAPIVGETVANWSVNLGAENVAPVDCTGAGCAVIEPLINTTLIPLINTAVVPIRDFLVGDGGHAIYDLLITDIKTNAMTLPVRQVLEPVFTLMAQIVSVQLNRQVTTTCEGPDGTLTDSLEVSALSIGLLQAADAGRLNLGTAGVRIGACDDAAVINPAITLDPTSVAPGESTNLTGTGFTPDGDVTLQLTDPSGNPVGDPITVPADPEGNVPSTAIPVPEGSAPGDYKVVATDVTTDTPVESPLTVTDGGVQPGNGSIGDLVFDDADMDGVQDEGEAGVPGTVVNLLDADGNPVNDADGNPRTTTTDENGIYSFGELPEGDYTVQFVAPEGKAFSPADQGGDDALDSDPNAEGVTPVISVTAETPTTDAVDAGLVDDDAAIDPAITLDPTSVAPGESTNLTGTGFTPEGDVTLQLTDPDGNPVGDPITVPADPEGNVPATAIPVPEGSTPGDYTVVATDVTTDTPVESPLTVTDGGVQPGNGTIGDTVFSDDNGDGLQDAGEPGVPGVVVNLLDADGNPVNDADGNPVTTTTDENGNYSFGELPEGQYSVQFVAPEGKAFSPADQGDDDALDSDAGSDGRTPAVALTSAAPANDTVDAGLVDADGEINPVLSLDPTSVAPGESTNATGDGFTPEGDVTLQLTDPDGNPVGDPITVPADPEGNVPATEVPVPADAQPGDYTVVATDVTTDTPVVSNLTVTDGGAQPGPGSLGDFVFEDTNSDGLQDEGEPGVPGVVVNLLDADGNPVNDADGNPVTTTTDENGNYSFGELALGGYTVQFVAPEGKAFSPQGTNDDGAVDSDPNAEGVTNVYTLTEEAPTTDQVDAGLVDDDAVVDPSVTLDPTSVAPGESTSLTGSGFTPEGDVTVQLTDPEGNPVGDPITVPADAEGNVPATEIPVPEDAAPGDYKVVATDVATDTPVESPLTVTDGSLPGGNGELGDRVWNDLDSDGVQDDGEAGVSGVTVNLLDAEGNPVNDADGNPVTATTDDNGNYTFAGLALGEYTVEFVAPEGASFTQANAGDDDAVDSDAAENGRTEVVALTSTAPANMTVDAGIVDAPAVDEATVTVNPTEVKPGEETQVTGDGYAPNSDVTVQLVDPEGNPIGDPITVTTDENGHFTTPLPIGEDVEPGDYSVSAEDAEGNKDTVDLTVAEPDGENPNPNPGGDGELGDRVWRDANSDGIQDSNESGLAGAVVNLLDAEGNAYTDAEGNPITTTTDDNGSYAFTGLALGEYIVEFAAPEGASFSPAEAGDDTAVDSNAGENGRTSTVTLTAAAPADRTIDAGIVDAPAVEEATVTVNPDEVAPGESTTVNGEGYAPNSKVAIQLKDKDGNPVGEPAEVTTDENGSFSTEITVPEDAVPGDHTVEATDEDGNTDDAPLTVTDPDGNSGDDNGELGDRVWRDDNGNGLQDDGESGLGGVTVNLLDAEGNPVAGESGDPVTTTTNENGTYTFAGLKIQQYIVEFEAPEGASFAPAGVGEDRGIDSDAGENGRTEVVTLTSQAPVNQGVDAGITDAPAVEEATVTVNPETVAPGESTIVTGEGYAPNSEVTVTLTDKDGNPLGEPVMVTTDENGHFSTEVTVPEDAEDGDYTVAAEDAEGNKDTTVLKVVDSDGNGNDGASIGDFVWNDSNKDGIQSDGEAGVPGVGVSLLDSEGNAVLDVDGNAVVTTTGEDGKYGFGDLNYGEYTVQFNAPTNATFTTAGAGDDRSKDSDANQNGRSAAVQLSTASASNQSVDAGLIIDENAETPTFTVTPDEVAPGEEITIDGEGYEPNTNITIELRDKDGNVIETIEVMTDDEGKFTTNMTVPEDAEEGDYKVATVDPKGVEQTRDLRVTDKDANTCAAEESITVTPSKVKAGETVTVKGQGFTEGQVVEITVTGEDGKQVEVSIGDAAAGQLITIDESCGFEFKIQLPEDIKEGPYTVDVNDEDGKTIDSGEFEVVGSNDNNGTDNDGDNNGTDNNGDNDSDNDNDGLANTGAEVIGYSVLGLLVAAGGVALTVMARRRSQRS